MLRKQAGYTILELFLGLALGIFLLGGALFMYLALMKSFYSLMAVNQLDSQLRNAMTRMVQDIRRAGYSATAINDLSANVNTNPFVAAAVDISVPVNGCILFAYDKDSSGVLPALNTVNSDKRFGYRLSGTTLQSRASTDTSFSCTSGSWQDISDTNLVSITGLTFALTPTSVALVNGVSTVTIRNVDITLSGALKKDATVARTLTETVRVRNDRYQP
jgi:prepilin peptidase dependent protein B